MVSTELLGLAANPRGAIREPQSASCGPVASRSSQIAARSIEARHVLRHDCSSHSTARSSQACAHGVDRAAWSGCKPARRNPRAAIRELWASRKPQLADCSSQHRGQACAEARLQLAEHRSQLADRGAGSPVPPIAACTSQLARRRLLRRESKADPILLSQNRRPHSRRSQHFGQEVKAEVNCGSHSRSSLVARCRSLSRRGYLHEDRLHACKVQGA